MTGLVAVLIVLAAVNPVRRRYELPPNRQVVGAGAMLAWVALLSIGLAGEWVLDTLDITVPTFRVAVGLVLAVRALVDAFQSLPEREPVRAGRRAAVVPVLFPILLRPEIVLVAVVVGADAGIGWLAVGLALALADPVWWAERESSARLDRALGVVISVAAIVLAVALLVDGVFAL